MHKAAISLAFYIPGYFNVLHVSHYHFCFHNVGGEADSGVELTV